MNEAFKSPLSGWIETRDAIQSTDLAWIDAEAFTPLPDTMGIVFQPPSDGLQIYASGPQQDWHPVSDLLLVRVKDPDNFERICDNLKINPETPNLQVFYWIAGTRDGLKDGRGSLNWGVFGVHDHMKLDDLLAGLEAFSKDIAAREGAIPPSPNAPIQFPPSTHHKTQKLEAAMNASIESMHADCASGTDQQTQSMLGCVEFLAKFVLLSNCDWFTEGLTPIPPPGVKAQPHKARKLWDTYGHRYRLELPPHEDDLDASSDRSSPIRHRFRGFFRSQPYGAGRTSRKIIWVRSFWRGKFPLL